MNDHPESFCDPNLVVAAYDGRVNVTDLADPERGFVVQALSDRGESVGQIAERLHCSRRLVQRIRQENRERE